MQISNLSGKTLSQGQINELKSEPLDVKHNKVPKKEFDLETIKIAGNDEAQEKIEQMLADIEELKNQIDFDLTVENVMKYKKVITSFLEFYTENAYNLKDVYMKNKEQYTKKMTIVNKIEDGLSGMDNIMGLLDTKNGHLDMLNRIGKINGLIIDLRL